MNFNLTSLTVTSIWERFGKTERQFSVEEFRANQSFAPHRYPLHDGKFCAEAQGF